MSEGKSSARGKQKRRDEREDTVSSRNKDRYGASSYDRKTHDDFEDEYDVPANASRTKKRDKFKENKKSGNRRVIFVVAIAIALFGGYMWYSDRNTGTGATLAAGAGQRRSSGAFTEVKPENGTVRIPVANFADGKAKFYTYKAKDKEIDFFILKSSDGVIRAAIDSCDVCYTFKKGYRQEGDEMVCNNCGQRFPSVKINEVKGGCNPSPLTRTTEGDSIIIQESNIIADGSFYF